VNAVCVEDVFEMKYAHTPMEASPCPPAPRSDVVSKPDVTKTSAASAAQGRKDVTGDGDESEEERERRLHELQEQVTSQPHTRASTCTLTLTCKIVSEMTYNVSSGTLNPTIPYHVHSD